MLIAPAGVIFPFPSPLPPFPPGFMAIPTSFN